jgi:hypothetical protein
MDDDPRDTLVPKRGIRRHWLASQIVRREACKLAIQNRYFNPEWFAEFKDYLHNDSPPFSSELLRDLCLIVVGTQACEYCTRRRDDDCILGFRGTD